MTRTLPAAILLDLQARSAAIDAGTSGMYTTKELCRLLNVSNQAVSLWVKKGTIPHFRLGSLRRFDPEQLIAWLRERQA